MASAFSVEYPVTHLTLHVENLTKTHVPEQDAWQGWAGSQQQVTDGRSTAEHEKHSPQHCMALETH